MRALCALALRVGRPVTATILAATIARVARASALRCSARREPRTFNQGVDRRRLELEPFAPLDRSWHCDYTIACADQPAHHDSERLEYPPLGIV